jgi:polyphosphate kinase
VEEIWVTLYRVAAESAVVEAMMEAARRGKRVTAVVEVQARFDEGANLHWAERMSAAGVRTIYGAPGLKVHAKLLLLSRGDTRLACLATGNFNEQTARIYGDHALLTSLPELTGEVHSLFRHLAGETPEPVFRHLLVAPFQLREQLARLVEREIGHARAGEPAGMVLKMNSLEDPEMIELLYRASGEGVETDLIVRGICCLAAGVPATSERIRARSIVDRFLEHARVFVFHHAGADRVYLASADLMRRNLNRRIEVAFPVADPELRAELLEILRLQLADDRKARELDPEMRNELVGGPAGPGHRSQLEIYEMLRARARVGPREETRGTPHPEEIRWPTSAPR